MTRRSDASSKNRRPQSRVVHHEPPVVHELRAPDYLLGSPVFGKPKMKEYPEFVSLQLKAIEHFGIDASAGIYPTKDVLVAYFKAQRLSNVMQIDGRKAEYLAMFCRGVEGLKGGYHRRRVRP
jgi:hypothetical protein